MITVLVAWAAALAVCLAAALFGQTARTVPAVRRRRRRSRSARAGLFLSLSGPWLALVTGAGAGALTGAWLRAAAGAACGSVLAAVIGLVLRPG